MLRGFHVNPEHHVFGSSLYAAWPSSLTEAWAGPVGFCGKESLLKNSGDS